MSERTLELFQRLNSTEEIVALIGQSEDVHFDCKEWSADDGDNQKVIAKAACGLTNAEGGVIVFGMKARPVSKDEPDLVESTAPVTDTAAVKSRVLDLIGQIVEPRIEGIRVAEVSNRQGPRSGFVVAYIPMSEGGPRRSRKDWKFYQRIGSGTFPMEYFQIEERFGRRPPPKLKVHLELAGISGLIYEPMVLGRWFVLGVSNGGAGIAKFPSIRCLRIPMLNFDTFGIDGNGGTGLPQRPSESDWVNFRGGVDDLIYPGELRKITKLYQRGQNTGANGLPLPPKFGPNMRPLTQWFFKRLTFSCEVSCEGAETQMVELQIPEHLEVR